ncbi:response regulator [Desulfovibrio oxyclinae]|jgi:two-component system chemotaxis response regulator CheY|uniref:response regulator n=1 Tax=Desulfovibrio oxyclinae TaxID=63560 RepID=UPI00036B50F1|nr:response regulator [Desulfovibrio oxyclinae]
MSNTLRTLVVEDTMVTREFLRMVMQQWGECACVETGEEAVTLFEQAHNDGKPFDLVVLDIMLPGMNGQQTLETLREVERKAEISEEDQVHVIITTALDDDETASRAFIHGKAVSFITKPVRMERLEEEVQSLGLTG